MLGDNEESISKYFEEKLDKRRNNRQEEHTPINDMFTYGISENCVHLHMPVDLHKMIKKRNYKNSRYC